jgi:serine/threonine-protein kinase Chk1
MKYSPHLTRFFSSLPPNKLVPLLIEALNALGVKHKVKPPATVLVGGYDVRKEKFKGRIVLEGFEWRRVECSIVEMAREEVREMSSEEWD